MGSVAGSCFGFDVRADLPLRFVRAAGGGTPLHVYEHDEPDPGAGTTLFEEWEPDDAVPVHVRLHRAGAAWRLWIEGAGWYLIDPDAPSIGVPAGEEPLRREERLWGLPTLLCFLARGDVPLHAAAIDVGDGAVIVGAPSAYGKTTLAAGFWRAGHRVLGDDLACVRLGEGTACVVPGPPLLRLRPDMAERLAVGPGDGAVALAGRVRVPLGRAGDCAPVPLRAIVLLGEERDDLSLVPVAAEEAIPQLWELSFHLSGVEAEARAFTALADLAGRVPVLRLHRPLSVDALPEVVRHVVAHA